MQSHMIKICILAIIMSALSWKAQAAEGVAVVPLFSATGNATTADVRAGKTFSNSSSKGLTGTRSPAPIAATGQAPTDPIAAPEGSDGALHKGVSVTIARFTNNGDGTVTDNLTGLVWLRDASCNALGSNGNGRGTWEQALTSANGLSAGACGLSDASASGDWRLPNLFELASLLDFSENTPALTSGYPFTDVENGTGTDMYWTSTTVDRQTDNAWIMELRDGSILNAAKTYNTGGGYFTWPVRDAD